MRFICRSGIILALAFSVLGAGPKSIPPMNLPSGATLFIGPMEWDMDGWIRSEMGKTSVPLRLVDRPQDADFVMTGTSMKLDSRLLSSARAFQVKIVTSTGQDVWAAEAYDTATFFGRLRRHGAHRAAQDLVRRLRTRFFRRPKIS